MGRHEYEQSFVILFFVQFTCKSRLDQPEVWEDDDVGGGVRVHVLVGEGHHQEEEITDHEEQEALVEGGAPAMLVGLW